MIWSEQYGWNNKAEIISTKYFILKWKGVVEGFG
jgi:hypothetical protein